MTRQNERNIAFLDEMGLGPLWITRSTSDASIQAELQSGLPAELRPEAQSSVNPQVDPEVKQVEPPPQSRPIELPVMRQAQRESVVPQSEIKSATPDRSSASSRAIDDSHDNPPARMDELDIPPISMPMDMAPIDISELNMADFHDRMDEEESASTVATMGWDELKSTVSGCVKCGLCKKRKNTVFGVGDEKAKWLFIGEGPGRNEDARGEPFVGPAGKLLDNMMLAIGLKRGDNAYIANIVKCRPTDATGKDRPPTAEEAAACMPYLLRQIELIQPTVIVALGKTAALHLLKLDPATPVSALRGKVHQYAGLPLIVTYHPAYLLRSLTEKRKAWADLCMAMQAYSRA